MNLGATQAWVYSSYLTWDKWTSLCDCDYPTPIYEQETLQPCLWPFTLSWWLALTGTVEDTRRAGNLKEDWPVSFAPGIPGWGNQRHQCLSAFEQRRIIGTLAEITSLMWVQRYRKSKDSMALEIGTLIPDSFSILDPNLYWNSLVLSAFGFLEIPFIYPVINLFLSCSLSLNTKKIFLNSQVQTKQ